MMASTSLRGVAGLLLLRGVIKMQRLHPYAIAFLALTLCSQQIVAQGPSRHPDRTLVLLRETLNRSKNTVDCSNNGTYLNGNGQTVPRPENCLAPPMAQRLNVETERVALQPEQTGHVFASRRCSQMAVAECDGHEK